MYQIDVKAPTQEVRVVAERGSSLNTVSVICNLASAIIDENVQVELSEENKNKIKNFLNKLSSGYAEVIDINLACREICVFAQAALEKGLVRMLNSRELKDVNVLFLTPLPCTPLRNPEALNSSELVSPAVYTVDERTRTVRQLRESGAKIFVAYSESDFNELSKSEEEKKQKEAATYNEEKTKERMIDCPLNDKISPDLVGALYQFKDVNDKVYYLATQGIQIQASTTGEEHWKKWLGDDQETLNRAQLMIERAGLKASFGF
jgi:hypothetical protein